MKKFIPKHYLTSSILVILAAMTAFGQGNAFNFQGRLNDGTNPANGSYDLQFRLYNAATGGAPIGSLVPRPNATLINGVFSVNLDFGADAFNNPNSVFIEIGIRPNGSTNAYTILGPRQQLTVVPFAVRATNAANAEYSYLAANATLAVNAVNAENAQNSNTLNGLGSSDFIRNSVAPIANQNFNIVGNGVINGTLNVAGSATIGSPTITSNLNVSGNITAAGNAAQNRNSNGLVKAMIHVNPNGTIARCYNGITGASTGNCGFSVTKGSGSADVFYTINFGFQVNDRFISVTPGIDGGNVNIGANASSSTSQPNTVVASMYIPDVSWVDSSAANSFMLIVY